MRTSKTDQTGPMSMLIQVFAGHEDHFVCLFRFNAAFNNFSVTIVSRCDRELNANFYGAASLKYHAQDT